MKWSDGHMAFMIPWYPIYMILWCLKTFLCNHELPNVPLIGLLKIVRERCKNDGSFSKSLFYGCIIIFFKFAFCYQGLRSPCSPRQWEIVRIPWLRAYLWGLIEWHQFSVQMRRALEEERHQACLTSLPLFFAFKVPLVIKIFEFVANI